MRLIDADSIPRFGGRKGLVHSADIDALPTIDAVPVVRCGKCKHVSIGDNGEDAWCDCTIFGAGVSETGYCWLGERKDGAE